MYIKSGVYGITGLRAIFSCYLGSGIPNYNYTPDLINNPSLISDPKSYDQSNPRTSWQNFIKAGPAVRITEYAYITIQEYENEKPNKQYYVQSVPTTAWSNPNPNMVK